MKPDGKKQKKLGIFLAKITIWTIDVAFWLFFVGLLGLYEN